VLISNKQQLLLNKKANLIIGFFSCNLLGKHNKLRLFIKVRSAPKKTQQVAAFYKSTQCPKKTQQVAAFYKSTQCQNKKHNKLRLFTKQKLLISFQKKTQQKLCFLV